MAYIEQGPVFQTADEHFDALTRERNLEPSPAALTPIQEPSGGGQDSPPAQGAPSPSATPGQGAPLASDPGLSKSIGSLFNPIQQGVQRQGEALQKAWGAFQEQAGPSRTFESVGGAGTIDKAAGGGGTVAEQEALFNAAKSLVGAKYQGPQGLEEAVSGEDDVSRALGEAQRLRTRGQALTSLGGIGSLLQELYPSLTPGQLLFESQQLQGSPEFLGGARTAQQDVSRLYADILGKTKAADQFAQQRTAEEKALSEAARGYATGKRQDTLQAVMDKVAEEEALRQRTEAQVEQFRKTGSIDDLRQVDKVARSGDWKPGEFITDEQKLMAEAQEVWDRIWNRRYADIKDVPMAELRINSKGKERWGVPEEWWTANSKKFTPEQLARARARASHRQWALAEAGFSPGTALTERGKYAHLMPAFYGAGGKGRGDRFEFADPRQYMEFDPGVKPSMGNVSTEEQRKLVATINRILDVPAEDIQEPEVAHRRASLIMHLDDYLADEEAALKARGKEMNAAQAEWTGAVRSARKKVKKAKGWFRDIARMDMGVGFKTALGAAKRAPKEATGSFTKGPKMAKSTVGG